MNKLFSLIAVLLVTLIAIFAIKSDATKLKRMSVEGHVWHIDWESKNHKLPLIEIKQKNGVVKKFSGTGVVLTSDTVEEGDHFRKLSGSKNCFINEIEVECLK